MFLCIVEIKAKCSNPDKIRKILKSQKAKFVGIDHQIDTYFKVNHGRLKLREGKIENNLIYYERENKKTPRYTDAILFKNKPKSSIKEILIRSLGIFIVVDKKREIYFIDNVKFHIDRVKKLGSFVEIEALGEKGSVNKKSLLKQCQFYMNLFGIVKKDLVSKSYSDLIKN